MFPWSPWSRDDEKRIAEMSPGARAVVVVLGVVIGLAALFLVLRLLT